MSFRKYLKVSENNSFGVSPFGVKKKKKNKNISVHFTNFIRWKQETQTEIKTLISSNLNNTVKSEKLWEIHGIEKNC